MTLPINKGISNFLAAVRVSIRAGHIEYVMLTPAAALKYAHQLAEPEDAAVIINPWNPTGAVQVWPYRSFLKVFDNTVSPLLS